MELHETQIEAIEFAASRRFSIIMGGAGCLTGDTVINIHRKGHPRKHTLERAFAKFNHVTGFGRIGPFWPRDNSTYCLADIGDKIGYHKIDHIIYSGEKEVYLVTDSFGNQIKATKDHKFLTGSGLYLELRDLAPGDWLVVNKPKSPKVKKKRRKRRVVESLKYHQIAKTHKRKIHCKKKNWTGYYYYQRVHYARLVVEAELNMLGIDQYIDILKNDETKAKELTYLPSKMEVHHKDFDSMNDHTTNLQVLSKADHAALHCKESSMQNQFNKKAYSIIQSIEYVGIEHTYDIVMKDPHRNFVANNFVVHNSGKTTIIKEIAERVNAPRLCAFAGKAAARLKEATGRGASTIHRLLQYQGDRFALESLAGVTVIVDEASMVSSDLMAEIMKRRPDRLILVGDEAQLPPVGKGQPFHDLIEQRPDSCYGLTKCFRNTEAVFKAATAIRSGEMPVVEETSDSEKWQIIKTGTPEATQRQLLEYVAAGNVDFEQDIILCPRNGDNDDQPCTVKGLNKAIVDIVNPRDNDDEKLVVGDRVINTKNYADHDVWNGTTGTVHAVNRTSVYVRLDIPIIDHEETTDYDDPIYKEIVEFEKDMRKTLQLAYALTVHRAQGSQYRQVVFIALERDARMLLSRSLLYTAVTRTKESCIVAGQIRAVMNAVNRVDTKSTVLQELYIGGK